MTPGTSNTEYPHSFRLLRPPKAFEGAAAISRVQPWAHSELIIIGNCAHKTSEHFLFEYALAFT